MQFKNGFSGASISSNGIITLSAAASAITRNSGNTFNVIASASGVNSTNVAVDLTARTIGSTANPLIFNTIGSLSVADTGSGNIDVSVLAPATLDVAVNVGGLGFGTIKVLTGGTEAVNIGDNLAIGVVNISGPFAFTGTGGGITQTGAITATGRGVVGDGNQSDPGCQYHSEHGRHYHTRRWQLVGQHSRYGQRDDQ